MGKRRCMVCNRRFTSGAALAGHMGFHAAEKRTAALVAEEDEKAVAAHAVVRSCRMRRALLPEDVELLLSSAFVFDRDEDGGASLHGKHRQRRPVCSLDDPAAEKPLCCASWSSHEMEASSALLLMSGGASRKSEADVNPCAYKNKDEEEEEEQFKGGRRSGLAQRNRTYHASRTYRAVGAVMRFQCDGFSGATAAHGEAKLCQCFNSDSAFGSDQALGGGHKRQNPYAGDDGATFPALPPRPPPRLPVGAANKKGICVDLNLPPPSDEEEAKQRALNGNRPPHADSDARNSSVKEGFGVGGTGAAVKKSKSFWCGRARGGSPLSGPRRRAV